MEEKFEEEKSTAKDFQDQIKFSQNIQPKPNVEKKPSFPGDDWEKITV